jgi:anaerobic selenocysteine-containing dehydrogenase
LGQAVNRCWISPSSSSIRPASKRWRKTCDVDEPSALQSATIRSHDQYNTTIYSLDDRYRGVFGGRMVVFMNEDDMAERQIEPDSFVELESVTDHGDARRIAIGFKVKLYNIPRVRSLRTIRRLTICYR